MIQRKEKEVCINVYCIDMISLANVHQMKEQNVCDVQHTSARLYEHPLRLSGNVLQITIRSSTLAVYCFMTLICLIALLLP
jgi:hypothetical protein